MSLTAGPRDGLRKFENLLDNKHMKDTNTSQTSTPDADFCGELRTMSGPDERLKVAAYTEEQILAFCRSHEIPRRNVARIRRPDDLYGWRTSRLLLLPSWWLGTNSDTVPAARERGWETVEVTEDEVLNGPKPEQPAPAPCPHCVQGYVQESGFGRCNHCNPAPSATPRTDEVWAKHQGSTAEFFEAVVIHARTLERELAEAIAARKQSAAEWADQVANADQRVSRMKRERDEARELIAVKDQSINAANQTIMFNNVLMRQATDKLAEAIRERDDLRINAETNREGMVKAQKILDAGRWAGFPLIDACVTELEECRTALKYIHQIVSEKDAEGKDLEVGSTAMKSVLRWASGELKEENAATHAPGANEKPLK